MRQKGVMRSRERAATEDYCADDANGLAVRDAYVTASSALLHGHFWNDGHAHSRADHAQNAAELAALENNLRMQARAIACRDGGIPETMAVAQEKKRFRSKILKRERAAVGERMLFRERSEKALGEKRETVELLTADGQGQNGDIHFARADTFEERRRNVFDHAELRLRKLAREKRQPRRKKVRRHGRDHSNADGAADRIFALNDIAFGGLQFTQHSSGARKKGHADIRETNRAAEAIEQSRP